MAKSIVVCSDGTWNTVANKDRGKPAPTNVLKTFHALAGDRAIQQAGGGQLRVATAHFAALYDPGVGTEWYRRLTGGAFGAGLSDNVMDGYRFVAEQHEESARIVLFGFSRGAYTARSLGGMITKCGLARRANFADDTSWRAEVQSLYTNVYRNRDLTPKRYLDSLPQGKRPATPDIEMIGVWDTVGALGIPTSIFHAFNRQLESFHNTALSNKVKHGYHAVALDEAREAFEPTLWDDREGIEQVWFAGVHSNIGGGYQDTGLSDIALSWMLSKAKALNLGAGVKKILPPLAPNFAGELRDSREGLMRLSTVKPRDVAATDRAPVVHGSALRRIADRPSSYSSVALRNLRPERIEAADGQVVHPPQDYSCRVCLNNSLSSCGSGVCSVRFKSESSAGQSYIAATCKLAA
jgi:uncharacterized protein (DUF2235 family)